MQTQPSPPEAGLDTINADNLAQHIQTLQIQIHMMEQHITMIEYQNKFVRFTPQGLRAYRQWIYNLRLRQAQLRWQLSRAMTAQVRR